MTTNNVPTEARKLNMEEKRKLEKLLLSDVDTAIIKYGESRVALREKAEDDAIAHVPKEVKALFVAHVNAQKEAKRTRDAIEQHGFRIDCSYPKYDYELEVGHNPKPKSLRDFDVESAKTTAALTNLKRSYTLKLFAGGEEAQVLFASLARELAAIVK